MKKNGLLVFFASVFALSFCLYIKNDIGNKKDLDTNVIVRLKDSDVYSKEEMSRAFYNELVSIVSFNYRNVESIDEVLNFKVLKVNSEDINKINNMSTVEYAYEEIEYYFDPSDPTYDYFGYNEVLDTNYSEIEMNIGEDIKDGENTIVAVIDSCLNYNHEAFQNINTSTMRYTKEDIDSKAASNGFNAKNYLRINDKIPFSYDYCNDDNDVLARDTHGSHVSSLAVGNGRYKGVANEAQLAFMKVFTDNGGGCTSAVYLKALEDAYLLDVDAVNMSFGNSLTYGKTTTDLAVEDVLNKLRENGTNVFISAGNDGREQFRGSTYEYSTTSAYESGMLGSIALNEDSITVANATLSDDQSNVHALVDKKRPIELFDRAVDHTGQSEGSDEWRITDFPTEYRFSDLIDEGNYEYVMIPNKGKDEDYAGLDVKNKIAVVERGELNFTVKIYNAIKNGASGLIIYNQKSDTEIPFFSFAIDDAALEQCPDIPTTVDQYGETIFDLSYVNIPIAVASYEAGKRLNEAENKVLSFYSEELSLSSSMGATADLRLKPDLSAPGENIYGAWSYYRPNNKPNSGNYYLDDAYTYMSGTSMASPNLMGAYVSLLSTYGIDSDYSRETAAKLLRNKMYSNTTILEDEDGVPITPRKQGNGLVNIDSTYNSSAYLLFNDDNQMELGNDSMIQNGVISGDIHLFEESASNNYEVSIKIMAPKIIEEDYLGKTVKLVGTKDVLLEEKILNNNFQTKFGDNIFTIDEVISSSTREYLSQFENGTYLEGYITFKSENNTLNMPFLGYYGEYYGVRPYEPFSFEKDPNKLYESDLMDDYLRENLNQSNAYTGSYFMIGDNEIYYKRNILSSSYSFIKQYNEMEAVYDEYDDIYHIYTGEDYSRHRGIIVQLYMLRTIKSNRVTMYDKNGSMLEEFYLKDNLFDTSLTHELYRNYILIQDTRLTGRDYYTHRSYLYIPLVENDSLGIFKYQNGEYTLEFEFTFVDDSKYVERYQLHIGETYKSIPEVYDVSLYQNLLRVYVKEQEITEIIINNKEFDLGLLGTVGTGRYYFDLNLTNYTEDIFISINNADGNVSYFKYFIENNMFVSGENIDESMNMMIEVRNKTTYLIHLVDSSNYLVELEKEVLYGFVPESYFTDVQAIDGNSTVTIMYQNVTSENELIRFNSSYSSFLINNELNSDGLLKLFLPLIISVSIIAGITIIVISVVLIKDNRKKNKK